MQEDEEFWCLSGELLLKLRLSFIYKVIAESEDEALELYHEGEAEYYTFDVDQIYEEEIKYVDRVTCLNIEFQFKYIQAWVL